MGESFGFLEMTVIPEYRGFLLFVLPPGGFVVLGLLMAGKRVIDARMQRRLASPEPLAESGGTQITL